MYSCEPEQHNVGSLAAWCSARSIGSLSLGPELNSNIMKQFGRTTGSGSVRLRHR